MYVSPKKALILTLNIIRKTKRATGINRNGPKLKRNVHHHKTKRTSGCAFLIPCPTLFFQKNSPGFAGVRGLTPGVLSPSCSTVPSHNYIRMASEHCPKAILSFVAFRFGSLRDRFSAFRLRGLDQRFVRCHARRFDDFTAEGQARADIRARIRSIVTRIRARHTRTRARVVVAAIDHTACSCGHPILS